MLTQVLDQRLVGSSRGSPSHAHAPMSDLRRLVANDDGVLKEVWKVDA